MDDLTDDCDDEDAPVGPCGNCYEWDYAPATLNGVPYCMSCGTDASDVEPVYAGIDYATGPDWTAVVLVQFDDAGQPIVEQIERYSP